MSTRVAVDIGGTFTDVVAFDEATQEISIGKSLSTPDDLIRGIKNALAVTEVQMSEPESVIHGSTVVINALIERKGARTCLITTAGFRDIYEIGRVNRPDAFNFDFVQHRPLIPREHIFEVPERLNGGGSVVVEFDEDAARAVAETIAARGFDAVAVVFLHAYRNPAHEIRMGELLRAAQAELFVSLSHEVSREYREFERTSTVAANAFVGPIVSRYLARLQNELTAAGNTGSLAIMQSNGGLSDVARISAEPIQMMESGPAGGVIGCIEVCRSLGLRDAIAFDMGGTTAKASVIRDLTFPAAAEYFVGGYASGLPMQIPCLDIVEVGTGGGSTAWVDAAGGVHVGPQSAGAKPGPACYGQGGIEPTVTDAAVVLGFISGEGSLAGGLQIDHDAARTVIGSLADTVGLDLHAAAAGVLAIAASSMANAVRAVTTERGLDPRDFALFAYGGNGPLHISLVARELGISRVIIPQAPAVFSALGMLMTDLRRDSVVTNIRRLDALVPELFEQELTEYEVALADSLAEGAVGFSETTFLRSVDMRYVGQEHSISVDISGIDFHSTGLDRLKAQFDAAHQERFNHSADDEAAEIVTVRVSALGRLPRIDQPKIAIGTSSVPTKAVRGTRELVFGRSYASSVYTRAELLAGNVIHGPAVIEEATTTTLLRPGDIAEVDSFGNLNLTIGS
ncbi:hydantoinase/oxoprolinase family protein [Nocardia fluminea]|uniref:hydantoinase/oxoprolinase family protein n=1 Tax=Nocardia fluminea TaxID=134984 RepID=UPI0033DE46E4